MAEWMDWVSLVSSIFGIMGFFGVIIAVFTFCADLRKRAKEDDVGRVCCKKDEMGYFAIKEPSLWRRPWHYFKKVKLPIVPTISSIIKAGDDLAFTSALFDSIPANHDEVCWLGIYEGFFNELAWKNNSLWNSFWRDRHLKRYAKQAAQHVERLRRNSHKVNKIDGSGGGESELEIFTRKILQIWNYTKYLLHDSDETLQAIGSGHKKTDLEKQTRGLPYLDRHVLYEPTFENGPHLVNCVRYPVEERLLEKNDKVWIYNKKPCIETSTYQLFALSFILGLQMKCRQNSPTVIGYGAAGMTMTCLQNDAFGQLHLAYSSDFGDIREKPMGSGYSTLFAKHLACGSLPIEQTGCYTRTLLVDSKILKAIQKGKILDFSDESHLSNRPMDTLLRMPSSTSILFYCEAKSLHNDDLSHPNIRDCSSMWYWWKAVAGIAFGGLVPQSTWNLVEAVKFTALGGLVPGDYLGGMRSLIQAVHQRANKENAVTEQLHLFGSYEDGSSSDGILYPALYLDPPDLDTRTAARVFSCYMTLLECVTALYWHQAYTTLNDPDGKKAASDVFEVCCEELGHAYKAAVEKKLQGNAKLDVGAVPASSQVAPQAVSEIVDLSGRTEDAAQEISEPEKQLAFKSEAKGLDNGMEDSVHEVPEISEPEEDSSSARKPKGLDNKAVDIKGETSDPNISYVPNDLGDAIYHLAGEIETKLTAEICGQIARFIITAWAHQVKIIAWEGNEIPEDLKKLDLYLVPSPDTFPDISALGGI